MAAIKQEMDGSRISIIKCSSNTRFLSRLKVCNDGEETIGGWTLIDLTIHITANGERRGINMMDVAPVSLSFVSVFLSTGAQDPSEELIPKDRNVWISFCYHFVPVQTLIRRD